MPFSHKILDRYISDRTKEAIRYLHNLTATEVMDDDICELDIVFNQFKLQMPIFGEYYTDEAEGIPFKDMLTEIKTGHHGYNLFLSYKGEKTWLQFVSEQYIDGDSLAFVDAKKVRIPLTFTKSEWGNQDFVAKKVNEKKNLVDQYFKSVEERLNSANTNLKETITTEIEKLKAEVELNRETVNHIGIPVRKIEEVSNTFILPIERKKVLPSKKAGQFDTSIIPEPVIESVIYQGILKVIHDVFRKIEKLPSTFKGKQEEDLRDLILIFLESHFEGSTAGETFNKSGKTDILLSHEGKNTFIAELKMWRGPQSYFGAIDQLLSYLTWRDSKSAVILFVDYESISDVLEKVKAETEEHRNFLRFESETDDGWYNYIFHLDGDKSREMKIAVMLYHLPKK